MLGDGVVAEPEYYILPLTKRELFPTIRSSADCRHVRSGYATSHLDANHHTFV